jgi:hypothetical protein
MADPVSWFLIEPGWKVVDATASEVGKVDEIVGDSSATSSTASSISTACFARGYVPAEQVAEITEGRCSSI